MQIQPARDGNSFSFMVVNLQLGMRQRCFPPQLGESRDVEAEVREVKKVKKGRGLRLAWEAKIHL